MPIENMTPEQIAEATRAQVTAGIKGTSKAAKLAGETYTEANARLTAAYKELVAKPILTEEQIAGGMKVQYVRTDVGGFGEYIPIKPLGYTGPTTVTSFTNGVIPEGAQYTTGSAVGLDTGGRTIDEYRKVLVGKLVAGNPLTAKERSWLDTNGGTSLNPNVTVTKTVVSTVKNADGTTTTTYSDGTKTTTAATSSATNTGLKTLNGILYNNGIPFNGKAPDGKTYTNGMVDTTGNNPEGTGVNTVIPGSTGTTKEGGPTLAVNTFKNTLALFFGANEMTKPWVDELYKLVNPYYKSGSSIDEAFNMAIQEGRKNPNLKGFTDRFKGIYDLQDKLLSGVAVTVPTIAEFVASEAKMGDVLNQAGLSSLNQQSYLGDIIGKGVNVTEFTNRVNDVFLRIDRLPQQAKDFISGSFPTLDRTSLAKAILGGEKGAIALSKELGGMEVQAAGKAQGLGIDTATGLDIAARGFGYKEALTGFGTVAEALPTYERLQEISTGKDVKTSQVQSELQGMVFNKSVVDSLKAQGIAQEEINRFSAKTGNIGSKAFASQSRGAGLI